MKRRAGSAPSEDALRVADAAIDSDIDMLAPPLADNSEDVLVVDGDHGFRNAMMSDVFAGDDEDPADNASTTAQGDDQDEDQIDLLGLNMDSSYEPLSGFDDTGENAPVADNPGGIGYEVQEIIGDQDAGSSKDQANESSTPNTDEAADSDAKTADTTGTSTSVEEPVNTCKYYKAACPVASRVVG